MRLVTDALNLFKKIRCRRRMLPFSLLSHGPGPKPWKPRTLQAIFRGYLSSIYSHNIFCSLDVWCGYRYSNLIIFSFHDLTTILFMVWFHDLFMVHFLRNTTNLSIVYIIVTFSFKLFCSCKTIALYSFVVVTLHNYLCFMLFQTFMRL